MSDLLYEIEISKSRTAIDNVCSTKKICDEQGQITFGQLRELVESGKIRRIATHVGEGGYKALLRLVPWFLPQLVLLGFGATWIRVMNKLFRPTLEETTSYRTWWGKTILKVFNLVEGELNATDPLSKIFFISDGLLTMLDDKYKIEFARYIAEVADEQPNNEIVPEYFVENKLREFLNEKFFLDPPLSPKNTKNTQSISEHTTKKILLEKSYLSSSIRKIVRDVITIFKKNNDGQFNLPEELGDQDLEYKLPKSSVSVELIITPSDTVEDFLVNANFYRKEDVIVLKIVYNPKNKKQILYNLIGELNEVIAHELRHQYQRDNAMFGMDQGIDDDDEDEDEDEFSEEEKTGFEYYSRPEEIDAQVDGFKRMKYVTRRPFEELVRNWFTTHREIHQMNLDEEKKIIDMIINYYRTS